MTPQELLDTKDFQFGCIFGPAGSGKTHLIREVMALDAKWGVFTATTGAAARVLGSDVRTVHW
jgi:ABC-type polar amino acid transport system ATPase subunit